mmetsp:Transcript_1849/g.5989  ORF Transcript_1849/g.5989 Transcript_1849/m.5989 type:complete len:275 (+) Transcript_1849:131-955(+)
MRAWRFDLSEDLEGHDALVLAGAREVRAVVADELDLGAARLDEVEDGLGLAVVALRRADEGEARDARRRRDGGEERLLGRRVEAVPHGGDGDFGAVVGRAEDLGEPGLDGGAAEVADVRGRGEARLAGHGVAHRELVAHRVELVGERRAADLEAVRVARAEGHGAQQHLAVGGADVDVRAVLALDLLDHAPHRRVRQRAVEADAVVAEAGHELAEDGHGLAPLALVDGRRRRRRGGLGLLALGRGDDGGGGGGALAALRGRDGGGHAEGRHALF